MSVNYNRPCSLYLRVYNTYESLVMADRYHEKQYRKHDRTVDRTIFEATRRIWTRKIRTLSFQVTLRWKGPCSIIFERGSRDAMCSMHASRISTLFRLTNGELSSRPFHSTISYPRPLRIVTCSFTWEQPTNK